MQTARTGYGGMILARPNPEADAERQRRKEEEKQRKKAERERRGSVTQRLKRVLSRDSGDGKDGKEAAGREGKVVG